MGRSVVYLTVEICLNNPTVFSIWLSCLCTSASLKKISSKNRKIDRIFLFFAGSNAAARAHVTPKNNFSAFSGQTKFIRRMRSNKRYKSFGIWVVCEKSFGSGPNRRPGAWQKQTFSRPSAPNIGSRAPPPSFDVATWSDTRPILNSRIAIAYNYA